MVKRTYRASLARAARAASARTARSTSAAAHDDDVWLEGFGKVDRLVVWY